MSFSDEARYPCGAVLSGLSKSFEVVSVVLSGDKAASMSDLIGSFSLAPVEANPEEGKLDAAFAALPRTESAFDEAVWPRPRSSGGASIAIQLGFQIDIKTGKDSAQLRR